MLRSLYAGVSGMRNFQTKMDVVANNIANVNTTAFKSGRVRFQDMLNQTISNGSAPSEDDGMGGINPQQIGLGVKVGAIDNIMTGGALQPTNRDLDLAIEGEGFFAVSLDANGEIVRYTRDGAFYSDHLGNLVTASGYYVLDESGAPINIDPEGLDSFSISNNGDIIVIYDGEADTLGPIGIVTFSNPGGLIKTGNNTYAASSNSGEPVVGIPGEEGRGVIRQGFLEMSNVDLANEFTEMIITSRAYQANSRSITTSDEMLQELINLKR